MKKRDWLVVVRIIGWGGSSTEHRVKVFNTTKSRAKAYAEFRAASCYYDKEYMHKVKAIKAVEITEED